jgi:predicted permease
MDWLKRDLVVSGRRLLKDRVFSVTSLLTLAICIAANAALFAVVYNVLLRPLPVPEPERLVIMSNAYPNAGAADTSNSGVPDFYDRIRDVTALGEQALVNHSNLAIGRDEAATRVHTANVTPSYFRMLKVAPILGRTFTQDEGEVGKEKKVVLSERFFRTRLGADPAVVGRDLRLDGQPYTIVGVMPRSIDAFDPGVLLWRPLAFTPEQRADSNRHSNNYWNLGRLKPGATVGQVRAQVDALNAANLVRFPQYADLLKKAGFHTIVRPYAEHVTRHVRPTLRLLWGGALFVLLIGGVNVANLALVRARARSKELATRLAIGAGAHHLVRQLVVESTLLSLVAAGLGVGLGALALKTFGILDLNELPYGAEVGLSTPVVLYTVAIAAVIGLAMGLVPVIAMIPKNLTTALREEGRASSGGRSTSVLRRTLVIAQVAFTFVLLAGAGLLFASFRRVTRIDPGFDPDRVLTASVSLSKSRYPDDPARVRFTDEALRRIRALPGVVSAGMTDTIPFGPDSSDSVILAEGYRMRPEESVISPASVRVSPGFFETMGVKLAQGRFFRDGDGAAGSKVIMVDEKLAKRFWPDQDPVGRRMYAPTDINDLLAVNEKTVFMTVVGVIRDVKLHDLTEGEKSVGAYFIPQSQDPSSGMTFAIKTTGDPLALAPSVRRAIASIDPELPVHPIETMDARSASALLDRRSPAMLSLGFGLVALLLSAVGIYGVLAYLVTQRSKEIGIRLALGSSTRAVFELVLREGLLLLGVGFAVGLVLALVLKRTLESLLYGVEASDPLVLLSATGLLAIVALTACAVPARRATRIDPAATLRSS